MFENILWVLAAAVVGLVGLALILAAGLLVVFAVVKVLSPVTKASFWNPRKAERVADVLAVVVGAIIAFLTFCYFGSLVLSAMELHIGWPDVPAWMSKVLKDK